MLLNSTSDLKLYFSAVQSDLDFDKHLAPTLRTVEPTYIVPYIGAELYA